MEDAQNLANSAFESFLGQDYKVCMETLNKLKSGNLQNERDAYRIKQNLFSAEFVGGKTSTVSSFSNKIEELFQEIRPLSASQNKSDLTKSPGDLEEDLSGANAEKPQEIDNFSTFRYNYAVALQLSGKKFQSAQLLKEIFENKGSVVDDFVLLKAAFAYLELAIIQKDGSLIKQILDFFDRIRKYISIARAHPIQGDSLDEGNESSQQEVNTGSKGAEENKDKEIKSFNSLTFGSEIYKHGVEPNMICKQEFNFLLSIYQINFLLSVKEFDLAKKKLTACQTMFNNFAKVIKEGKDEKGETRGKFPSAIAPFIDRHANVLFSFAKANLAYQTASFAECMKTLNTIDILSFSDQEILGYTAFQLNNMGCCHLKMKKYGLAAYYLGKALNILQKLNKEVTTETRKYERNLNLNAIQFYPTVLYNYALATFQSDKKDQALEAYVALAEFWPDNPKIWYRTGLCHISKAHEILQNNQNQKKNSVYHALLDVPNYGQLVEEEKAEQLKSRKTEDIEHKENPYYTRYVLQTRENTLQKSEEEFGATGTKFTSQNQDPNLKINEEAALQSDKELRTCFESATRCFRNAVLIVKKKILKEQIVQITLRNHETEGEEEKANDEGEERSQTADSVKSATNLKELNSILQSSLAHLAYTSLSQGEINNTINYAKECLELPSITEEHRYMCLMYLVESSCCLGNQKEALNQMNSANVTQTILTVARNALGINQASFLKNLNSKIAIYTNLATAHILNGNLTGAQNAINIALSNVDPNLPIVPVSVVNLMVYLNLKLDKPETALQILKRRKVTMTGTNNKLLLRIVKWMS